MPRLTARARVANRDVVEMRNPFGVIVRAVLTPDEYAALAIGALPARLVGDGEGWRFLRAAGGMATFDTADGLLHDGDWFPGDAELPPLLGTTGGATVPIDPGMILSWDGDDATLSPEAEAMLAEAAARGI